MIFLRRPILAGCLLAASVAPTAASSMPQTQTTPPSEPSGSLVSPSDEVIDALLLGETEAALDALGELLTTAPEHADAWSVYRAEAWKQGGDLEEAEKELSGFEERFPKSPWLAKVRFERAAIARALGKQADAEVILREEATTLRSAGRRIELGEKLMEAAEELSERADAAPSRDGRNDLRAKASSLLKQAHGLKTTDAFQRRTALALTKLALAQGDWNATTEWAKSLQNLMEPTSLAALEAGVTSARAKLAQGMAMEARRELMDSSAGIEEALAEPGAETLALQGLRGYTLAFLGDAWRAETQPLFAIDAWERLIQTQPDHPEAARAAGRIAEVYAEIGRAENGIEAWKRAETLPAATSATLTLMGPLEQQLERQPGESRLDAGALKRRALFRRAQLQASIGRNEDAIASFTEYVSTHPGAEDWNAAQEGLVSAHFARASSWLETSDDASLADLEAAESALLEFADSRPLDHRASDALFQWATLRETYANEFMQDADRSERDPFYGLAVERLEDLARRTVNSDQELSGRSLLHAAVLVQDQLEDPRRAIAIYERVTGSHRGSADARLREMQQTLLLLKTTGLVRPGEPLVVDLDTRNIEEVTLQAVRLDLGQYFQRHGTTEGIERLDLDLIAPDVEVTAAIDDYETYANLSRQLTVPVGPDGEPGAYAVTVVADGKRATTLVLRSELDLIVKRSAGQVFVLVTETDAEGHSKVAPGAEVTISYLHEGKRETATLTTDAGGVASLLAPESSPFGRDTRVFATRGGHVAAARVTGSSRGKAIALEPRATVQLDRTAYRPGDEIGFRAVLRGVQGGGWQRLQLSKEQLDAGERFTTELIAPNGVAIARVSAKDTSASGTLSGRFELDPAAPSGVWSIRTTAPSGLTASTGFVLGEIEVPRVALELSSEETVILRGETLEIVAAAETAWGSPLAGTEVRFVDPSGKETRAVTDPSGRATLRYETNQALAGDTLSFEAQLPEQEGIHTSISIQVALSALSVDVHVSRDVVLAGETFNARVRAVAPDGKTEATEVRLVGTRRYETRPGRFAEERILDETVTTDDTGTALVAVSAQAGGQLVLLASARDRFGREVTHECSLEIAGANDREALRVLARDTSIRAGENGSVRVVDRSKSGGLALMTIEGSEVLEHRVISLAPGVNELTFAAAAQHVPDVQLSISAIRGRRFHERSATFRVTRPLEVSIDAPTSLSPEGTAEIIVRTTDGLGHPVEAEFSLALVDRALLAAYPRRSASVEDVFEIRGSRTPAFVSAASATFRYRGITKEIDAAILDEDRRADAEAELEDMRTSVGKVLEEVDDAPMRLSSSMIGIQRVARSEAPLPGDLINEVFELGGGAGGRYGGKFGGRRRSGTAVPEVGLESPTAYWNAAIMTGPDGVARVSIPMPDLEATWQLDVAGITADHRFGSETAAIVTRSPIVATIDAPAFLREGDAPQLRGELTLEEPLEADAKVTFELHVAGDPRQSVQRGTAVLAAGETRLAYTFEALPPVAADRALALEFVATVEGAGGGTARDTRSCSVRAAGYFLRDTAAGRLLSETAVDLELKGAEHLELTLIAGATEAQWLVDATLGGGPGWRPIETFRGRGALAAASQLQGSASLLLAAGKSGGLAPATIQRLRERCDSLIGSLLTRVSADGGWTRDTGCWRGRTEQASDAETTARAIIALAAARSAGRAVPSATWEGALRLAGEKLSSASNDEERALLCWALETGGKGHDLVLNRLHRDRERLDAGTRAALALALVAAGKGPMAVEVAGGLDGSGAATSLGLDQAAMALLARARAGVATEADRGTLRKLLPWVDPVGRGMAVAAEVAAGALSGGDARPVTFEVAVDGGTPETIQIRPHEGNGGTREVSLPLPAGGQGTVQVRLRLVSGPALDYALVLEGYSAAPPEPRGGFPFSIDSVEFRGPLPRWRGRPLEEGFRAVEVPASVRWEHEIEGLGFGESGRIILNYRAPRRRGGDELQDLVLEVPLPAGIAATVTPAAGFGALAPEIQDGILLAGIASSTRSMKIVIDVTGTRPGKWTLGAPVLRSARNPGLAVFGEESSLTVYAPGEVPVNEPRPTPDERLSRGRLAFEDGDMPAVLNALKPLYSEWQRQLRPAALAEVARLLLFASLKAEASGDAGGGDRSIVDWFEILKERDPDLFVSFDDTLRIAGAYRSIGEPLRSNLLYRAVIDETLGEDLRVAAAMDSAGEWMRASQLAAQIWRRYPDSPAADDADLALANRWIERGLDAEGQPRLPANQRSSLVLNGIARMRRNVALGDRRGTVGADAGLVLVATYAQLEQWERAAERAELFGRVFEDPTYRDSFRYSEAVARWSGVGAEDAAGEERRAVEILESIANVPLKLGGGSTRWSPNRELALYILAQVYHARMDAGKAEVYYDRVDETFADARAALQELRAERLTLDEDVIRVRPGEVAKIRFDHKGIEGVSVLVYPVDLMTLALRERDLSLVTSVDLAGVTPTLEASLQLERSVLRPATGEIDVALERPGAYLAMLRGGDVHRSALLLATDLELDVVLPGDGSVRAQTMLASTGTFASGVAVRILGESADWVKSLETDRRGVATVDGLQGKVTVIARATASPTGAESPPEQHYAFEAAARPTRPETAPAAPAPKQSNTNYLSNIVELNDFNRISRQERVDKDVQRTRKGVQVQQAK